MAETIHSFIGGMDLDTDKSLRSNTVTGLTQNLRLINNYNGTTGALTSVLGNTNVSSALTHLMGRIVGYCVVRNYLVVFGKSDAILGGDPTNVIYKLTLDTNDNITDYTRVYSDSLNNDQGLLNFPDSGIKAVGRYESENIIKVYWVDDVNPARYINIAINNTTDGEEYNGTTNDYVATDKLEFISNFNPVNLDSVIVKKGGTLTSGVIQYSYQLYNKYGTETLYSPLSNPIHIVESSETTTNVNKYEGSDVDTSTGKSVQITINHTTDNNGYDGLKVIRVQYTTYGQLPTVNLVADIEINKYPSVDTTYTVIDTGRSLYQYTVDDIAVVGRVLFSAKDLATKDDLLFYGNITEDYFDVDFDARAFRFPVSSVTTYLTDGGIDSSYVITSDTDAYWDLIADTHDCINLYNDFTNQAETAAKYVCKYQRSSTTMGGTGRNVKYRFVTSSFVLDNANNTTKSGANNTVRTLSAGLGSGDNYSYTNYASPYMSMTYKGYQRGEVYRFGIVFFDKKGRSSKVKWIGDIKFPSVKDSGFDGLANLVSNEIKSEALGIQFEVKNVPTDAVAWSIVRMNRTNSDKTVISQGVLSNTVEYSGSGGPDYSFPVFPVLKAAATAYSTGNLRTEVLAYISPDINYGDLDYKSGDVFETIGHLGGYGTYAIESASTGENVIKYNTFSQLSSTNLITPDKIVTVVPANPANSYGIGTNTWEARTYYGTGDAGLLGTCMLFTYTGTLVTSPSTTMHPTTVVNLRRINNSQYGGNTYENRFTNEYISCGSIVSEDSAAFTHSSSYTGTAEVVFGGDTYITMYERVHGIYYPGSNKLCRICYIPLESKYNLSINNGFTYSRNTSLDPDIYLIRENAGTHSDGSTTVLEQTKDFYVYNTVYSITDFPVHYYSNSLSDNQVTEYDVRVYTSEKKINNEIIDSWAKVLVSNYKDVASSYGPINNLITFKNRLFYLQNHGFGILAVNDRAIVTDENNPSAIVLGTGGVLERYDYITTYYGNTNTYGVLPTEGGIYWVDNSKSELVLYNGESVIPLSKAKKVSTFFKDNYNTITNVITGYNYKYNEVYFRLLAGETELNTLVYNELLGCFTSFYTLPARWMISLSTILVTAPDNSALLFAEDSGDIGTFYDIKSDAYLYLLHSEGFPTIKVYDNIEYFTTSRDNANIDQPVDTFDLLEVTNDYQTTGSVILTHKTNLERRQRNWTTFVPRNVTLSSKERMRDGYALIKLTYQGDNRLTIPYIKIKFRTSAR